MAEYCIGTAQFGMHYGIANNSGQPIINEIKQIVQTAVDNNIHYFDTAQSYGESEVLLGEAIKKISDQKNIKIISKLSPDLNNHNPSEIIQSVKSSLGKLNVSSLYGFLAHRIEAINSKSFLTAIKTLKNEGHIINSGVSVYTPEDALKVIKNNGVDILQIPINILDKRWLDRGIIEEANENNIQVFFRSIFLQGLLFLNEKELINRNMSWAHPYLKKFNALVNDTPFSTVDLAFGILKQVSGNNVIIMGLDNLNQLQQNLGIIEKSVINEKVSDEWWANLPAFPEKLLNPSLWN